MKIWSGLAIALLAVGTLMWVSTESVAQECDNGGKKHNIQVRPGPDGNVELRYRGGPGDSVRVCRGDTVNWILTGSDRTFFVDFMDGAPFAGKKRRDRENKLTVTIDAESGSYTYDVGWDGDPGVDPVIIVD